MAAGNQEARSIQESANYPDDHQAINRAPIVLETSKRQKGRQVAMARMTQREGVRQQTSRETPSGQEGGWETKEEKRAAKSPAGAVLPRRHRIVEDIK